MNAARPLDPAVRPRGAAAARVLVGCAGVVAKALRWCWDAVKDWCEEAVVLAALLAIAEEAEEE